MVLRRRRDGRVRVRPGDAGQATVEFALVLPLVLALLMMLFQAAAIARDDIVVEHAARAAVREASVTGDVGRITAAATRSLPGATVRIVRRGAVGAPVEVEVRYVVHPAVPILGAHLPAITLSARAVMRVER